jgi:hypothetical protein
MKSLMQDIECGIRGKCCRGVCHESHSISLQEVEMGMKRLKKGQRDSIPGITTDNFIHG